MTGSSDRSDIPRDLVLLTALALTVRILVATMVAPAPWTDSAYYLVSGRQIAAGDGLTVPFVWSILETGGRLPSEGTLPIPSHAHWMPLTAFVAAAGMWIGGVNDVAARVPFLLLSTAWTPVAYLMAWQTWRNRRAAIAAGLLVIFAGPLLLFGSIVESFGLFGLAGAGAIHAAMRSVADSRNRKRWLVLSGLLVGIATLTRIEGVLLAVAPATAWLIGMGWAGWRTAGARPGWLAGIASAGAFFLVVAPWGIRNVLTFGTPLPSTGGHTLWIKTYNEQFSVTADTSLSAYLAQAPVTIVEQKIGGWLTIGGYTVALLAGIVGLFFVAGLWVHRRRPDVAPFLVYWIVMFIAMGALFTFHAPHGLFYHHASAWLPIAAAVGVMSVERVLTAGGRVWGFLARPAAHRFVIAAALVASVPFSISASAATRAEWSEHLGGVSSAAAFLSTRSPDDRVMYRDAPLLSAATGLEAVAPPYDPFPVIGAYAETYDVTWFVAQRQVRPPHGEPQGLWEGGRAADAEGSVADWLAEVPAYDDGSVRIFEVVDR